VYSDKSSGNALRARGFMALLATLVMGLGLLAMPSAAAAFAYVANSGSNTVSVVDMSTTPPTVVATVPVGTSPFGLALSPDGRRVYVANSASNTVPAPCATPLPRRGGCQFQWNQKPSAGWADH
jgi:YVTN family beta-propeller protein